MLEELKGKNVHITAGSGATYSDISIHGQVLDIDNIWIKVRVKDSVQYIHLNAVVRIEALDKDA
jgi:hypothetical protein